MVPFETDDPPAPEGGPVNPKAISIKLMPGVDEFSMMMYILYDNGRIDEYGRNNTAQWVFRQQVL